MSRQNVDLVRRSYRLLGELREAKPCALEHAFQECFDEGLEVRIPDAYPEGAQVFRGREGLKRWVASTREIWDEWRFEPERFLDAGDQVVVLVRVVARGGSSGVSLDRETAHLWTLRDRRVTRCEVFLDRSEALEAVGPRAQVPGGLRGSAWPRSQSPTLGQCATTVGPVARG
jgi:ketosteroid isomerase-like protein